MIDLHIHTNATPHHASWDPEELAQAAAQQGLRVIAAADHNTTANVEQLQQAGVVYGLRVISGVEIDSGFQSKLWHTLIYNADPNDPALLALCAAVSERNATDTDRLRERLSQHGFRLEELEQLDRPPNVADVATVLARNNNLPGRVAGEGDEAAGMRFLLAIPGAYNPVDVDEVISVAHACGGLAVLAHPGRRQGVYAIPATAEDIAAMGGAGLDGIEVYYPSHDLKQRSFLLEQVEQHGLLVSGGSDSHHPRQKLAQIEPSLVTLLDRLQAAPD
jgi:predicted metal-dependent phosphoesterase TrpH